MEQTGMKGKVQLTIPNYIIRKQQIPLVEFIVNETISGNREPQNVMSSIMKFLKRFDRI